MASKLVVLVTGCAEGGIGAWYSKHFHFRGCKVYATDVQPLSSMESLRNLGIHTLQLDVTSDSSVKDAVDQVVKREGRIDILVNNAGLSMIGPLAELPLSSFKKTFEVNVFGSMRLIQQVVPHMAARRQGKIVNVGSVVGYVATPWAGSYCSSKSSVHALTDVLRLELEPLGIKVMLVVPGSVKSQLGATSRSALHKQRWALYKDFEQGISERANSSQSDKATPTEVFAKAVVEAALGSQTPKHFVFGFMTGLFVVLRWCPLWAKDLFMKWRFGLLKSGTKALQPKRTV